jgi:hypothetical protein
MMTILCIVSGISFLVFGSLILSTRHMEEEFERYGLSRFRKLVGLLELLGGLGILLGLHFKILLLVSSLGLSLLMVLGVVTRLRVKDSFLETTPAGVLGLINMFIFYFQV